MKAYFEANKKTIYKLLTILGIIVAAYVFFHYLFPFITPFFIGWLLSLLFLPFVNLLEKKCSFPRWAGSLLSILLLLGFFSIVVVGAWNKLFSEAQLFYKDLPEYMKIIRPAFHNLTAYLDKITSTLPIDLQQPWEQSRNGISGFLTTLLESSSSHSFQILRAIPNVFMVIVVALISSYFFTKDRDKIASFVACHFPTAFGTDYAFAKAKLKSSVIGYFKTQLILMAYTFLICLGGLLILHSPYSFLLSVIISIIDAIPFFGSGFILWPGAIIHLAMGNTPLAVGYMVIYLCVNLMRQIMQPKILGTQIGLHPLLTLISMYIGLKCLGILGMILGPVVAVLMKAVYEVKASVEHLDDSTEQ